jgi:hypothetical protein
MWLAMFIHGMFTGGFGALWVRKRQPIAGVLCLLFFAGTISNMLFGDIISVVSNIIVICVGGASVMKSDYI